MLEKTIEAYLRDEVKALGGKAYKFVSPGNAGMPDRLIVLPGGSHIYAETKAPGRKPTPLQQKRRVELERMGCMVFGCVDSKAAVDNVLAYCRAVMRA